MNRIKRELLRLLSVGMALLAATTAAAEVVAWHAQETLNVEGAPLDVLATPDGRRIYVLTDQGRILVYTPGSKTQPAVLEVGRQVNRIALGPEPDALILSSGQDKTVQLITVAFVQEIDVSGSPFKGPTDAPVVIAVYDDFQCPYCARLAAVLDQVRAKYPNDVKVVFKHFPLQSHKYAAKAAIASMAADSLGKFWEFHDKLFENHHQLDDQKIDAIAVDLGLNKAEYEKKKQDPAVMQKIGRDVQEGRRIGVSGTPAVFVNGVRLQDRSPEGFQKAIESQLQKRGKASK